MPCQGSFNDLQSLLLLNLTIVTVGGLIKHFVVDPAANARNLTLDQDWYRVRRPAALAAVHARSQLAFVPAGKPCMLHHKLCLACLAEAERGVAAQTLLLLTFANGAYALLCLCMRKCGHVLVQKSMFAVGCHRHVHPAGVPMDNGTIAEKAFALAIAGSGLVAFALTVALIQQVGIVFHIPQPIKHCCCVLRKCFQESRHVSITVINSYDLCTA